jgi:hypothetical protein
MPSSQLKKNRDTIAPPPAGLALGGSLTKKNRTMLRMGQFFMPQTLAQVNLAHFEA